MKDKYVMISCRILKWLFKTMLVILGISHQTGCSSGYEEKNGRITFDGQEITNKNFIILSDEFGENSTTVFYKSKPFLNADIASFEVVDTHYAKDKNKVYFCDEYREGQNYYLTKKQTITEVQQAIPASFVLAGNGYAKDSKQAFFLGKAFKVNQVASFKSLNANFCKDDIQAYLDGKPIAGSDGKSFELLDNYFAKDKNHIYYCQSAGAQKQQVTILLCDVASFRLLEYPYSRDTSFVFYEGKKIAGADPSSFNLLGESYTKDLRHVYFESKIVVNADAATFSLLKENTNNFSGFYFAKDKFSIFIDGKKIVGADANSFKILNFGYSKDSNHIFYKSSIIESGLLDSFKTYEHDYGEVDAEDAANKYLAGKKVL